MQTKSFGYYSNKYTKNEILYQIKGNTKKSKAPIYTHQFLLWVDSFGKKFESNFTFGFGLCTYLLPILETLLLYLMDLYKLINTKTHKKINIIHKVLKAKSQTPTNWDGRVLLRYLYW